MSGILSNDEKSKIQKSNEDRKLQKKKKKSWVLSLYSLTNYAINMLCLISFQTDQSFKIAN